MGISYIEPLQKGGPFKNVAPLALVVSLFPPKPFLRVPNGAWQVQVLVSCRAPKYCGTYHTCVQRCFVEVHEG